jgi:hypothetical protein
MKKRYDEPDERPPDLELINHYLAAADPKNVASEEDQAKARLALVTLYRDQRDKVGRGELPYIDFRLPFLVLREAV